MLFGSVQSFYTVNYNDTCNEYASIHWYDPPSEDIETKLLFVNKKTHHQAISPSAAINNLSEPLIVACEGDFIFVMDFLDKVRMLSLLGWMEER